MMWSSDRFGVGGGGCWSFVAQNGGATGSSGGHIAAHQTTPGTTHAGRLFLATFDLGIRATKTAVPELAGWGSARWASLEDDGLGFCHDQIVN